MKENTLLSQAVRFLGRFKFKYREDDLAQERLGPSDAAVLRVAMMVSALDGNVSEDELRAFDRLAKKCRGYSEESAAEVLKDGLRSAGYLSLQAKRLSAKGLAAEFIAEVDSVIRNDFIFGSPQDIRRAFVMWTAMALADGEYSAIERQCIRACRDSIAAAMKRMQEEDERNWRENASIFAAAGVFKDATFIYPTAPTDEFLNTVENLLKDMQDDSAAEAALKELVVKG